MRSRATLLAVTRATSGLAAALLLLAGCEGCAGDSADPESTAEQGSATTGGGEASGESAGDRGPPPEVRVRAETDRYDRLEVAVENRGHEPARLASVLDVQRKSGDAFEEATSLVLAPGCERPEPEGDEPACITLVPGAVLYPCECGDCDELGPGPHRFVARSCGGAHSLESAPVALDR